MNNTTAIASNTEGDAKKHVNTFELSAKVKLGLGLGLEPLLSTVYCKLASRDLNEIHDIMCL